MSILLDLISTSVQRHPVLLREGLGLLRRRSARLELGNSVVVLDGRGVREVLGRPRDFLNGMVYAQKLKLGPLVLAMDASQRHAEERTAMERAAGNAWVADFEALVERHARRQLGSLEPADFVTEFVEPVLVPALCELFGIDPAPARSRCLQAAPGLPTFIQWLRKLGGALAASTPAPFGLEAVAEALAREEMVPFLEAQANGSTHPVLQRLAADLGPESVSRCVGGTLLATAALFKAATLALNQLLRQNQLEPALRATAGVPRARAREISLGYVREALRFDPPFAFLTRYCPRPTALGALTVPAGGMVFVSLLSAMFDPAEVSNPEEFSPLRPEDTYLPFGVGLHECVGKALAERGLAVLFAVFLDWLRERHQKVAAAGRILYDGPAVARYALAYVDFVSEQEPSAGEPHAADGNDDHRSDQPEAA